MRSNFCIDLAENNEKVEKQLVNDYVFSSESARIF